MSTSLLYHGFGVVGYHFVGQIFEPGITTFRIEQPRERLRCSHCRSDEVWAQGGVERNFRGLPIGKQPTFINFKVPRVLCFNCGKVRQVKIAFAAPKKHYTRAFERYALDLSRLMTIQDSPSTWSSAGTRSKRSRPSTCSGVSAIPSYTSSSRLPSMRSTWARGTAI